MARMMSRHKIWHFSCRNWRTIAIKVARWILYGCFLVPLVMLWSKWRDINYYWIIQTLIYHSIPIRPSHCMGCFPNFTYDINPVSLCDQSSVSEIQVLLLISSIPQNQDARDAIRNSWTSVTKFNTANVRHVFIFGWTSNERFNSLLRNESERYGDILRANFSESYANLTLKSVMGLRWASSFCPNAKYVMKTDDDMFINVSRLLNRISTDKKMRTSLSGGCYTTPTKPNRVLSKWMVSITEYPEVRFPPFCSGTGYILPQTLVKDIVRVSGNTPFIHLEDVYIGLCLFKLGVEVNDIPGFYFWWDASRYDHLLDKNTQRCVKNNDVITLHRLSPDYIRKIWTTCFEPQ